jgi:hypothetical protein
MCTNANNCSKRYCECCVDARAAEYTQVGYTYTSQESVHYVHAAAAADALLLLLLQTLLCNRCVHRRRTGASGNYQDAVKVGAVPVTGVLEFEKMER